MDWTSGGAAAALIAARAMHFGACALIAGAVLFRVAIADPAMNGASAARVVVDRQTRWIAALALVVALASGTIWFVLTAAAMGNVAAKDVLDPDNLLTVLKLTQFGSVAAARLALAVLVGVGLGLDRTVLGRWLLLIAALAFAASIAWTGHSGSGFGVTGNVQLIADVFHLIAASAWLGSLVPLALLLSGAGHADARVAPAIVAAVTRRFSTLGVASVAVLMASGAVNAFVLVGAWSLLTATEYGRVLLMKLVLFVLMLTIAAVNRAVLTPQLASPSPEGQRRAQHRLARHCVFEIGLGVLIISIAGWLGTLHPAAHFMQ
jgi:putative copper resistance protein D